MESDSSPPVSENPGAAGFAVALAARFLAAPLRHPAQVFHVKAANVVSVS
jgi:hypothetical protein